MIEDDEIVAAEIFAGVRSTPVTTFSIVLLTRQVTSKVGQTSLGIPYRTGVGSAASTESTNWEMTA